MYIPSADELAEEPINWLWRGRLALGKLALLDGQPGVGKSWLTLDLCARLSTGRPLPDGDVFGDAASCLVFTAEETGADVRRRLLALGADLKRVRVFSALDPGMDIEALRWPACHETWNQIVGDWKPALTVIDPFFAFLAPGAVVNETRLRAGLIPLQCLAQRQHTCPLLLRHLAKTGGGPAVTRGLGPIGLSGVCRSTWLVAPDPTAATERSVLAQIKNNLAGPQPSLAFSIREPGIRGQESEGRDQESGVIDSCVLTPDSCPLMWHGKTDWTAEQLLGYRLPKAVAPLLSERAREFLIERLASGPRPYKEILSAARRRGISKGTLDRARKEMAIRHCRVRVGGRQVMHWHFNDQAPPTNVVVPEGAAILEPWLRPLLERWEGQGEEEED